MTGKEYARVRRTADRDSDSYGKRNDDGKARFAVGAGDTKTVRVRLNARGRRTARGLPSLGVVATARLRSGVVSANVTITRP